MNASLAQRGSINLVDLDTVDIEMFTYLEELQQQQSFYQTVSSLIDPTKSKEFLKKVETAYFPHQEAADEVQATKTQQMLQEMQNKKYTIRRGPGGGNTLSVQDLDKDS